MRHDAERLTRCAGGTAALLALLVLLVGWQASASAQDPNPDQAPVFRQGLAAFEAGDPQAAYDIWSPAAEAGEPLAQYGLGKLYETGGPGFPADIEQSVGWYEKAAERGVPAALNNLARFYAEGRGVARDTDQAVLLWAQAAQLGHPHGQYNLGLALFRGEWIEQDQAGAVDWFLQAAAAGLPEAQFAAGQIFERGIQREADLQRSVEWYRRAADQGHVAARQSVDRLAPSLATATPPQAAPTRPAPPAAPPPVTTSPATPPPPAVAAALSSDTAAPSAELPPVPPRRPQVAGTQAVTEPQPQPAQVAERTPTAASEQAAASGGVEAVSGRWRVWLGSAADAAEAQRLAAQLAGSGSPLSVEEIETAPGDGRLRLLAGRFPERATAEDLCSRLRSQAPATFCIPIEE
ncbi:MAG: SPOR domain-containing protein [Kiloniellales bacterium]